MAPASIHSIGSEDRHLQEALGNVSVQTAQLRRCLVSSLLFLLAVIQKWGHADLAVVLQDADEIMNALKAASTMLAELRTSSLSPKQYYELCPFPPSLRESDFGTDPNTSRSTHRHGRV